MLDENEHDEQRHLVDYEEPIVNPTEAPDHSLHRAHPETVIELIAANYAETYPEPSDGCLHNTGPTTRHGDVPRVLLHFRSMIIALMGLPVSDSNNYAPDRNHPSAEASRC